MPIYRLAQFWLPMLGGAISYLSLRIGPWAIGTREQIGRLRDVTVDAIEHPESQFDWAERYGQRPRSEPGDGVASADEGPEDSGPPEGSGPPPRLPRRVSAGWVIARRVVARRVVADATAARTATAAALGSTRSGGAPFAPARAGQALTAGP